MDVATRFSGGIKVEEEEATLSMAEEDPLRVIKRDWTYRKVDKVQDRGKSRGLPDGPPEPSADLSLLFSFSQSPT